MPDPRVPSNAWFAIFLGIWCGTPLCFAQETIASAAVAARVNGREITVGDVQYQLHIALKDRQVDDQTLARLRYETLKTLIDRELVLQMLEQRKLAATADDVELAITRLTDELAARGRTLDAHLEELQASEAILKRSLRWIISWRRMLDEYMTDENLERYFAAHRRHFDGTKMRVAHILLKVDSQSQQAAEERAQQIRKEIVSGTLTFEQAAEKYSEAPTAAQGGGIGWIERHQPMPESFSSAAFALEPLQISEPVRSAFGIHLIECLEIQPGQRQWHEVRRKLEPEVAKYLFEWAAGKQRESAQIEILDAIPAPKEE